MRLPARSAVLIILIFLSSQLIADVKTRQKDALKFEGMTGRLMSMAGLGGDMTSTVAVKGSRMANLDDKTGQIIDLAEERVYRLDMKKKTYTIVTFDQMRAQLEQAREQLAAQTQESNEEEPSPAGEPEKEMEVDVDVQETGKTKSIAGHDTRQVILTITMREKDKTLEQGGGVVLTSDMWLAPRIEALDELAEFQRKFAQAVFGQAIGIDPRQANGISAIVPMFGQLAARMADEGRKLEGTALLSTSTLETVKSEADMKAAADEQSEEGGGIGGLAGRFMRRQPQARSKTLTMTHEMQSIGTSVTDADIQIPAGFKETK
jgi:hypothetical protein